MKYHYLGRCFAHRMRMGTAAADALTGSVRDVPSARSQVLIRFEK